MEDIVTIIMGTIIFSRDIDRAFSNLIITSNKVLNITTMDIPIIILIIRTRTQEATNSSKILIKSQVTIQIIEETEAITTTIIIIITITTIITIIRGEIIEEEEAEDNETLIVVEVEIITTNEEDCLDHRCTKEVSRL